MHELDPGALCESKDGTSRKKGPLNESSLRRKLEQRGYAVHTYVYPADTYFSPQEHEDDKMDAFLRGRLPIARAGNLKSSDPATS